MSTVNLLDPERRKASFDVTQMAWKIAGSKNIFERKRWLVSLLENDPVFERGPQEYIDLGDRKKVIYKNLKRLYRVQQLIKEHNLDLMEDRIIKWLANIGGISLHDEVFLPTVLNMTTPEQFDAWAPKALNYEWIGCYAQTEIAHGSNVRGLLTTCTFLKDTDEIEVHTPCLEATKWWPGALGLLSTHAVVYARLIVDGKDLGIHNFMVQIRNTDNHKPMPGITVGDIGPKWSTNSNDNGFLAFDHVRIPRTNMLMKYARLERDGSYSRPGPSKGSYGTMTRIRASIVGLAGHYVGSAVTIAVRYAAVRRQEPGAKEERAIIDYTSQQSRLFPIIAAAYALKFIGDAMFSEYFELEAQSQKGDYSLAAVVHATSCSLKSLCSTIAADSIEECRRSCGGHGFHQFSGLPELYASYFPNYTAEGDNWLLTQQSARYLLKVISGKADASGSAAYLNPLTKASTLAQRSDASTIDQVLEPAFILQAFRQRSLFVVTQTADEMAASMHTSSPEELWNNHLVDFYRLSNAHGLYSIVQKFFDNIERSEASLRPVLTRLFQLFALTWIQKDMGDFLACGFLSNQHLPLVIRATRKLYALIRPDAVALVDAFDKSDFELNSALGRYDGRYVETLYEWAQREPLNQGLATLGGVAIDGYTEFLHPLMHPKL